MGRGGAREVPRRPERRRDRTLHHAPVLHRRASALDREPNPKPNPDGAEAHPPEAAGEGGHEEAPADRSDSEADGAGAEIPPGHGQGGATVPVLGLLPAVPRIDEAGWDPRLQSPPPH